MGRICHAGQEIPESSDALFSCVWVSVFSFLFASSFKLVFRDPRRVWKIVNCSGVSERLKIMQYLLTYWNMLILR